MDNWYKLGQCTSRTYINTSIIETKYKVLLRWYQVFQKPPPKCFRGWDQKGTAVHTRCIQKEKRFCIRIYNFVYSYPSKLHKILIKGSTMLLRRGGTRTHKERFYHIYICGGKNSHCQVLEVACTSFEQVKAKQSWIMVNEQP